MPAVPGDPVRVLHVLAVAVINAVEVGVGAAVVPVAPCGQRKANVELESGRVLFEKEVARSVVTFAQGGAVIHAFVVVLVGGAEVGVVVVAQGVPGVPAVVGEEELVAVELVSHSEEAVLGIASLAFPVLRWKTHLSR